MGSSWETRKRIEAELHAKFKLWDKFIASFYPVFGKKNWEKYQIKDKKMKTIDANLYMRARER